MWRVGIIVARRATDDEIAESRDIEGMEEINRRSRRTERVKDRVS
jgi:hypothetical protein